MRIEDLAEETSEKLKSLSDEQLTEILLPYFTVTRPEIAPKQTRMSERVEIVALSPQKRAALALFQEEGLDLSFLRTKKKK